MVTGAFLLAAMLLAAPQTAVERPPIQIAVTESGVRVESVQAEIGDREILTPFGRLTIALDPVAALEDGGVQLEQLLALHATGVLDDLGLAQDLSTAGQLTALAQHCERLAHLGPRLEPYLLLEAWGARLDPVPLKLPREKRVAWLWDRVMEDNWIQTVLCAVRLREETSPAYQAPSERVVSIVDLRRALRSKRPAQRRAGGFIAGKQQEFNLLEPLMSGSLDDSNAAGADGAARGCAEVYPQASLDYWSRALATGNTSSRLRTARHLGAYSGRSGLKVLTHVLAASGHPKGDRFTYAGRDIFVTDQVDSERIDFRTWWRDRSKCVPSRAGLLTPSDPQWEYVDLGSRFNVTRVEPEVLAAILAALDVNAGEITGRSREDWLVWYLENLKPGDVRGT